MLILVRRHADKKFCFMCALPYLVHICPWYNMLDFLIIGAFGFLSFAPFTSQRKRKEDAPRDGRQGDSQPDAKNSANIVFYMCVAYVGECLKKTKNPKCMFVPWRGSGSPSPRHREKGRPTHAPGCLHLLMGDWHFWIRGTYGILDILKHERWKNGNSNSSITGIWKLGYFGKKGVCRIRDKEVQ